MAKIKLVFEDVDSGKVKVSLEGDDLTKVSSMDPDDFIDNLSLAEQMVAAVIVNLSELEKTIKSAYEHDNVVTQPAVKSVIDSAELTDEELEKLFDSLDESKKVLN